jgi:hypothetical protein
VFRPVCGAPYSPDPWFPNSGRTLTTHATSEPFPIKLGMAYRMSPPSLATSTTKTPFLTFQVNGSRDAHVPMRTTLDLSTVTARLWVGPPLKSISSRPPSNTTRAPFLSLASGPHSTRVISGSTQRPTSRFPTRKLRNKTRILEGPFLAFSKPTRGWGADCSWFIRLVFSNRPFLRFPKPVSRPRNNFSHPVGADDVVDADCYELNSGCYAAYGFEYKPGFVDDNAVCALLPGPC